MQPSCNEYPNYSESAIMLSRVDGRSPSNESIRAASVQDWSRLNADIVEYIIEKLSQESVLAFRATCRTIWQLSNNYPYKLKLDAHENVTTNWPNMRLYRLISDMTEFIPNQNIYRLNIFYVHDYCKLSMFPDLEQLDVISGCVDFEIDHHETIKILLLDGSEAICTTQLPASLESLNIRRNQIIHLLGPSNIRTLTLNEDPMTYATLPHNLETLCLNTDTTDMADLCVLPSLRTLDASCIINNLNYDKISNLESLTMYGDTIIDLSQIHLPNLRILQAITITAIDYLENFPNLETLSTHEMLCNFSNDEYANIGKCSKLKNLIIDDFLDITDIEWLRNIDGLVTLTLRIPNVTDLSPIAAHTTLTRLELFTEVRGYDFMKNLSMDYALITNR
jgi:hypothetical protein